MTCAATTASRQSSRNVELYGLQQSVIPAKAGIHYFLAGYPSRGTCSCADGRSGRAGTASANGSVRLVVIDEVAGPYQLRVGILPCRSHCRSPARQHPDPEGRQRQIAGGGRHRAGIAFRRRHPRRDGRGKFSAGPVAVRGQPVAGRPGRLAGYAGHRQPRRPGHTFAFNVRASEGGGFNLMFVIVAVAAVLVIASLFWSQLQRRRRITRRR